MNKQSFILIILTVMLIFLPFTANSASHRITAIKGDRQKVQVGTLLSEPVVLKVVGPNNQVSQGALVRFKVIKGEARLEADSAKTNAAGLVSLNFRAGLTPGEIVIQAHLDNIPGAAVNIRTEAVLERTGTPAAAPAKPAPAKPAPAKPTPAQPQLKPIDKPADLPTPKPIAPEKPTPAVTPAAPVPKGKTPAVIISFEGDNQVIPVGTMSSKELAVQIMDADGNPLEGARVKFTVTQGKAALIPTETKTDSKGIASAKVRMGAETGGVEIKAAALDTSDLFTVFNIRGIEKTAQAAPSTPKPVPSPKAAEPVETPALAKEPVYSTPRPAPAETPSAPAVPDTIQLPTRPSQRPRGAFSRDAANLEVVAGNFQFSEPGVRLKQPIVVYLTDADGNPTFGTVTFTIMEGNATIINREVPTDARGLASTFVMVNSRDPIKIVAEVQEKPGLSTIAYANVEKREPSRAGEERNPVIRSTTTSNTPGYPASIAFYEMRTRNTDHIEKTRVVQLEIGVSDFRNMPVSTAVKFSAISGKVSVLNPIVQTNADGRGICYVEVTDSMGIFTIEAQSMENPDLRALFKSGPEIKTAEAPDVVRPGLSPDPAAPRPVNVQPPAGVITGEPALIVVVRGNGQKGQPRVKLPEPIVVMVTDANGNPVKDVIVSFHMQTGRAIIHSPYARTNDKGEAETYVTLGAQKGAYEIGVRVRGSSDLTTSVQLSVE